MKKLIFVIFFIVFFFNSGIFISGQENGRLVESSLGYDQPFTVIKYSNESGLPQNEVKDIISLDDGRILVLTANGIVSYDGIKFREYLHDDTYKRAGLVRLLRNKDILLGVTYSNKPYLLSPFFSEIYFPSIPGRSVSGCAFYGDTLIVGTVNGDIYTVDESLNCHKLTTVQSDTLAEFYPFVVHKNFLYTSGKECLYRINLETGDYSIVANTLFTALNTNPYDGRLYGGSNNILYRVGETTEEIYHLENSDQNDFVTKIDFSDTSVFFITSTNGFYYLKNGSSGSQVKSEILSRHLNSLYYNVAESNLFVGCGEKGMLQLQLKNIFSFTEEKGVWKTSLGSVIYSSDKRVLFVPSCCYIYEFTDDTAKVFIDVREEYSSLAEIDGQLFAGTWGNGVLIFDGNKLVRHLRSPEIGSNFVHSIFKDDQSRLWLGTGEGVVVSETGKEFTPLCDSVIGGDVICFYQLRNGNMCIGGTQGVFITDGKSIIRKLGAAEGLNAKEVRSFYEDREGKLWIGTYDGGLYCYNKGRLTSINQMRGAMLGRDAFCIAPDGMGYIYITSNHGLWRISETAMEAFYEGQLKYLVPFYYGQKSGMVNPEFNGGFQNNFAKTDEGVFYFPSIEGLVRVEPEPLVFRKRITRINDIYINDTLSDLSVSTFKRNTHSVQFNFSCVNYAEKYNVYYQHRLLGAGENDQTTEGWSFPQKSNEVHLKMLPPGSYRFQVRAIDGFNDPSPPVTEFTFTILPHFYETQSFFIISVLLFIILLTFIVRLWVRYLRKRSREKGRIEKLLAEFELKAIQSKMNPHFIFNSLSSIKYFMMSGDVHLAEKYLDHFSSLIRKFLETSDVMVTTVNEEVKILKEYLEIEKMRIGYGMDYQIDVEENAGECRLPAMITQPHLENAIKHGISHLESDGYITLSYKLDNDILVIMIRDNGVGLAASAEINKRRIGHKSMGNVLVKERVQLMEFLHGIQVTIELSSISNERGEVKGTQVLIKVPQTFKL